MHCLPTSSQRAVTASASDRDGNAGSNAHGDGHPCVTDGSQHDECVNNNDNLDRRSFWKGLCRREVRFHL